MILSPSGRNYMALRLSVLVLNTERIISAQMQ